MSPSDTGAGQRPAAQAGLLLQPAHLEWALDAPSSLGFVQLHAENLMVAGGPVRAAVERLRSQRPLSLHGVGLSLGGPDPLDLAHLDALQRLVDWLQPLGFSEHLAWSRVDGIYHPDLLPLPLDQAALWRLESRIQQVQDHLRRPLLLENPASYLAWSQSSWSEGDFIAELVRRTGCGLLLDVNNAWVSAHNLGADPWDWLAALPLAATAEIHLAGHALEVDPAGQALRIDTHGAPVEDGVWALYRRVLDRIGPRPTVIERDQNLPAPEVLLAEAEAAWLLLRAAAPARLPLPPPLRPGPAAGSPGREGAHPWWAWSQALHDPTAAIPQGLLVPPGAALERRWAVHRNTGVVSLVDGLAATFGVCVALVGSDFFRAMAAEFVRSHPPTDPVLSRYGQGLAGFIAEFPPAASVPMLAEMARFEWLRQCLLQAPDAPSLDPAGVQAWLANPERLASSRWQLHPALGRWSSPLSVAGLWVAHQHTDADAVAQVDWERPEHLWLVRQAGVVHTWHPPPGGDALLRAMQDGGALGAAVDQAQQDSPDFDLAQVLAEGLRQGVWTAVDGLNETRGVA